MATMKHLRGVLALAIAGTALALAAEDSPLARFQKVEIAPTWTSIYIGTVSLKVPPLSRTAAGSYESTYTARVLPLFFYNESGRLSIRVTDDALRKLARGEPIEFTGLAVNAEGDERPVTGKATPADASGGKIKVRVLVSPNIELIFNTTYKFTAP